MDKEYLEFFQFSYIVCEKGRFEQVLGGRWNTAFPCVHCENKLDPSCVIKKGFIYRWYSCVEERRFLLLVNERRIE